MIDIITDWRFGFWLCAVVGFVTFGFAIYGVKCFREDQP